ncbi:MAG: DNA topoisomerase III [Flavobacterium psychrophilum]|nr:MAG: DNA topoisomerase III [Flavobacterium psychrophilum]
MPLRATEIQTPTLALICRQYIAHRDFKAEKFWQLQLTHTKSFTDFKSYSDLEFESKVQAEEAMKSIQRKGKPTITDVSTEIIQETAPLLYDLTALQKAANKKYGFSASETLEIAQGLYEKQFITYPRTGSKYITEDLWTELPNLIKGLSDHQEIGEKVSKIRFGKLNKHIVNESKVTDHHGLLVTGKMPSALSTNENVLYKMIALRLLEAVSDTCSREKISSTIQVLHYEFHTKSLHMLEPGWRSIQNEYDDHELLETDLPELSVGDQLNLAGCEIVEKQRKGPELFTEATLLSKMEHPESNGLQKNVKQALGTVGLGTPATRAAIIETLLSRQYIERKGRSLLPTAKGESVYELVKDMGISSVGLTIEWEKVLSDIENGKTNEKDFQQKIEAYTREITLELLQVKIAIEAVPELLCPKCKVRHLRISEKVIKCPDEKCSWKQFRQVCGILLPVDEISNLINDGKTSLLKGMKSKSGKGFSAKLVLTAAAEVQFAFEK